VPSWVTALLVQVDGPEPALASLPLAALPRLHTLRLKLARGALPKGTHLQLPPQLVVLGMSASSFGPAIAALDLQQLQQLESLELSALDTT
jgi:hypothetical protein